MDGVGVLEDELPTISVSALVTDSESDLVVRERVKKEIFIFPPLSSTKIGCFAPARYKMSEKNTLEKCIKLTETSRL